MKSLKDTYTLANGVKIPCIGFGTWQTPDGDVAIKSIKEAIAAGYCHIDTAAAYENEESVGIALKESGIKREDVFVTSKLTNLVRGYNETLLAIEESLIKLKLDYLDLFLIHWPNPLNFRDCWEKANSDSWRAMEKLYKDGKIRAVGVSNFHPHHIDSLLKTAEIPPMVNQIRICPGDVNMEIISYCKERNILLEAYSPLGTGKIFEVEIMKTIAEKYSRPVSQVCLRWSLQMGFLPLPKSITPKRIIENAQIFDFTLSEEDVAIISGIANCCGVSDDPDTVNF